MRCVDVHYNEWESRGVDEEGLQIDYKLELESSVGSHRKGSKKKALIRQGLILVEFFDWMKICGSQ